MTDQQDIDALVIDDNPAENRYEARIGDQVAELTYFKRGTEIVLVHTGVPRELEGRGIAGRLARFALEDARAKGLRVLPRCPYVVSYLERHPEYLDIVDSPRMPGP